MLGFSPAVIHYGLMSLVSLVAVTSFQSIGSILVIAFMIIPAMTAALWTRTLSGRLLLSCLLGTAGAVLGIIGAIVSDSSLAGMMAAVLGVFFIVSLIFAPATGILAAFRQRKNSGSLSDGKRFSSIFFSMRERKRNHGKTLFPPSPST